MNEQLLPQSQGDDSLDVTPEQALCDAVRAIRSGRLDSPDKCLILMLKDDGEYATSFYNSGFSNSGAVGFLEVMKHDFLKLLNGQDKPNDQSENWKND